VKIQGTKVLESREIRKPMHVLGEDAPEDHISARIVKYDGNIKEPQWMDVDEGRVHDHVRDTMLV